MGTGSDPDDGHGTTFGPGTLSLSSSTPLKSHEVRGAR